MEPARPDREEHEESYQVGSGKRRERGGLHSSLGPSPIYEMGVHKESSNRWVWGTKITLRKKRCHRIFNEVEKERHSLRGGGDEKEY